MAMRRRRKRVSRFLWLTKMAAMPQQMCGRNNGRGCEPACVVKWFSRLPAPPHTDCDSQPAENGKLKTESGVHFNEQQIQFNICFICNSCISISIAIVLARSV